ncbi:MAG: hypothetical protein U1D67_09280 [Dehalococcoidia bacterium]|nr:hypothetical protein [Dehalococcoidia bacterium]
MDNNHDNQKMEDEMKRAVIKAFRQSMRSLAKEPSLILEVQDADDMPEALIREIESMLFKRRDENGNPNS